jgi:serine/threonine-protein kinase RsbW
MALPSKRKDAGPRYVRMRMASRREAVAPMVERILEAVRPVGFSDSESSDLAVALAEALSNGAVHGNRLRKGSTVKITIELRPGRQACIEVEDAGSGFDASKVKDPTEMSHILIPGGRGVFLMRRLVDELAFYPPGNRVRLTKRVRHRRRGSA